MRVNSKVVVAFMNDPDLCPWCFEREIKYKNVFNNDIPIENMDNGQKYYAHCQNCGKTFHILWEKDKFAPIVKDEFMKEFVDSYTDHKTRREK